MSFVTKFIGLPPTPYSWRLNKSILSDPIIEQDLSKTLDEFFLLNPVQDTSISTTWVTHKAFMRGKLIEIAASKNRERNKKIQTLTRELDTLYKNPQNLHNHNTKLIIDQKRTELNTILSTNAEKALRFSKAKFLLNGNTASTMFARKLNQSIKPPHVYKLNTNTGLSTSHPKEVLQIFEKCYSLFSLPLKTMFL